MWYLVLLFQNIRFAVRYHIISCDVISYKIRSAILEEILFFLTGFVLGCTNIMLYVFLVIFTAAIMSPCFLHCFFNISAVDHRAGSSPPPLLLSSIKKEYCLLIVCITTAAVLSSMHVCMYVCIYSNFYCSVILTIIPCFLHCFFNIFFIPLLLLFALTFCSLLRCVVYNL